MDIYITFKFTEEYYNESYNEMVLYRLKYRKWLPYLGTFSLVIGVLYIITGFKNGDLKTNFIVPLVLFIIGINAFYDYYTSKRKWMKQVCLPSIMGETASIRFRDNEIEHVGPNSSGLLKWSAFNGVKETNLGVFLLQNGTSVYLPKRYFQNENEVQQLIEKLS